MDRMTAAELLRAIEVGDPMSISAEQVPEFVEAAWSQMLHAHAEYDNLAQMIKHKLGLKAEKDAAS